MYDRYFVPTNSCFVLTMTYHRVGSTMSVITLTHIKRLTDVSNATHGFYGQDCSKTEQVTNVYETSTGRLYQTAEVGPEIPDGLRLVLALFLFVVFVIGIVGNATVIWVSSR